MIEMVTIRGHVLQQVWPWAGILCCDRVWSWLQFLCRDRVFSLSTELVKVKRIYVTIEYFCVTIEFGLRWGFYVAIKYSYAVTEFGLDMRF